ncbi:MAG: diaminopimelate decarboxylase [Clostridia bacterium]|nr:diaminopimelate decarboxylase [Clostridia bacterium]
MYCKEVNLLHDNLSVRDGHLCFAGYDTVELAKKYGTPLMLLDEQRIRNTMRTYKNAMEKYFGKESKPLYASKALSCIAMYQIAKEEGIYTDIVSIGELYTAKRAGFPLENAFFHGNSKTDFDIEYAIENGIGYFVVDTSDELYALDRIAEKKGVVQKILLRITPGIDPHTHSAISTGKVDSKFGTAIETGQALEITASALCMSNLRLEGFHCHIGSQIFEIEPYCDASEIMLGFIDKVKEELGFTPTILNLGGGFGVRYVESDPVISYEENIKRIAEHIDSYCEANQLYKPTILMEPGRSIVADSGMTIYTVGSVKKIPEYKNYVAIDGGMADNPRYALYQSSYTVLCANKMNESPSFNCTIAGRLCESGDLIQENVMIPPVQRGDNIAVLVTGAYNYAMSSNYNRVHRPLVLMLGESERIAIKRESFEDVSRLDEFLD